MGKGRAAWFQRRALLSRLAVQDRDRIAVELSGARVTVPDAHRAELAKFRERSDQVKHDPLLGRTVEMQSMIHRDVYQVVGDQAFICRILEVVRCKVVARLTGGCAI